MRDAFAIKTATLGDDEAVRAILADVCDVTGMGFAAVARVTEERWIACQLLDRIEFGLEPGDELAIKTTICNDIRDCGQAIVIDSVVDDIERRSHPTPMLYGFESYASFPITLADGSFFGTLCAIDPAPRTLSGTEIVRGLERHARALGEILSRRTGMV